jgi:hypothetical protein
VRALLRCLIALILVPVFPALAGEPGTRWEYVKAADQRVRWVADGLAAAPEMAESFTSPLGYRIDRYLWKAQKPAGSFAIAVLRDLSEEGHYLSGSADLIKFATTVLKGLEAPTPKASEPKDVKVATPGGPVWTRRFDLGTRQCVVLGFYAEPQAPPQGKGVASRAEPLSEGSLRLDGVYCAAAGRPLTSDQVLAYAAGVKLEPRKN